MQQEAQPWILFPCKNESCCATYRECAGVEDQWGLQSSDIKLSSNSSSPRTCRLTLALNLSGLRTHSCERLLSVAIRFANSGSSCTHDLLTYNKAQSKSALCCARGRLMRDQATDASSGSHEEPTLKLRL